MFRNLSRWVSTFSSDLFKTKITIFVLKALEKKWREGPFYHFASPALQDSEEKKIDLSDKNCFTRSSKPIEPLQMDHMRTVKWVTKKSRYLLVRSGQEAERFEGCFCTFSRWTREPEAVCILSLLYLVVCFDVQLYSNIFSLI